MFHSASADILLKTLLQGNFSTWLDKTLVINHDDWFHPGGSRYYVNETIFSYSDVGISSHRIVEDSLTAQHQPEFDLDKNCTAVLTGLNNPRGNIIVVGCNATFSASFICAPTSFSLLEHISQSMNLKSLTQTCPDNYLLLQNTNKCFLIIETPTPLMWRDANVMCTTWNGTVISVVFTSWPQIPDYSMELKRIFKVVLASYTRETKIDLQIPLQLLEGNALMEYIFGHALKNDVLENYLLENLRSTYFSEARSLILFANINNKCAIVDYSLLRVFFQTAAKNFVSDEGWGAKYRSCSDFVNTPVLICQQNVVQKQLNNLCSMDFFNCIDGTCVLYLYVCDLFLDCFDGSDEKSCYLNLSHINSIRLSTELSHAFPDHHVDNASLRNAEMIVLIHTLCDGLYLSRSDIERKLCKMRIKVYKNPSKMHTKRNIYSALHMSESDTLITKFIDEWKYKYHESELEVNRTYGAEINIFHNYTVACEEGNHCIVYDRTCSITNYSYAKWSNDMLFCKDFSCPGLFKCVEYFCLAMSQVCDGHIDCRYGDDEMFCDNLTCPGLLKCRGENRCISYEELCNGHIDCLYSYDDELYCSSCPVGCQCFGYLISCATNNSLEKLSNVTLYTKGIVLEGTLTDLTIESLSLIGLIYINSSYTGTKHITSSSRLKSHINHIIFADFSYNYITDIMFLSFPIFFKITTLDLTNNYIVFFGDIKLKFLYVLYLTNNNIITLFLADMHLPNIKLIDIGNTGFPFTVNVLFYSSRRKHMLSVQVTNRLLCCFLKTNMRCIHEGISPRCYGVLKNKLSKGFLYGSTMLSICLATLISIKCLKIKMKVSNPYNTTIVNQVISDWFIIIYCISIVFADILNVNIIEWRKSWLCLLLNFVLFVSLECSIIFKCFCVIIMVFKIVFPFKHQCQWLRYTAFLSCMLWLCTGALYSIHIAMPTSSQNQILPLDIFCSLGECIQTNTPLKWSALLIDLLGFISFFVAEYFTYKTLNLGTYDSFSMVGHTKTNVHCVMINIGRILYADFLIRIYLNIILVSNMLDIQLNKDYCFLCVIFLRSVSVVISEFINIFFII